MTSSVPQRLDRSAPKPRVIYLHGPTCSGKTFAASEFLRALHDGSLDSTLFVYCSDSSMATSRELSRYTDQAAIVLDDWSWLALTPTYLLRLTDKRSLTHFARLDGTCVPCQADYVLITSRTDLSRSDHAHACELQRRCDRIYDCSRYVNPIALLQQLCQDEGVPLTDAQLEQLRRNYV